MIIFKKEKEVIELITKHADKMEECLSTAIKTIQAYLKDNIDAAKTLARETDKIELEADLIRHEIRNKLYSGAYMPLIREELKYALLCYLKGICPVEVARQHSKEIGLLESKVDKMEWDITKKIFSSDLGYSHKIHLRLCLESIVSISDLAEDAADRLELVTLKSMI